MSAPHADRDASEQPIVWPPQQRRDAQAKAGTSRSVSARAARAGGVVGVEPVRASVAQVEAAMSACKMGTYADDPCCWRHNVMAFGDFCPVAKEVADAVVAAGPDADEVTRLRRWKAEASEVILGLQDLGKALGLPLGERITGPAAAEAAKALRSRAEAADAAVDRLTELASAESERRIKAEAERDALRATVARVGSRLDRLIETVESDCEPIECACAMTEGSMRQCPIHGEARGVCHDFDRTDEGECALTADLDSIALDLRAALSAPDPAPTTPETPQEPAVDAGSASGQSGEAETPGGAQKPVAHWATYWDERGPLAKACRCEIGEDHDAEADR